jgi:hypothetical protein
VESVIMTLIIKQQFISTHLLGQKITQLQDKKTNNHTSLYPSLRRQYLSPSSWTKLDMQ